jgi:hypothetical protein
MNTLALLIAITTEPALDHGWRKPIEVCVVLIIVYNLFGWLRPKMRRVAEMPPTPEASVTAAVSPAGGSVDESISPEVVAVIAAAVQIALGGDTQIGSISAIVPATVETSMQQWSVEGRREIYSSHHLR